MDSSPGLLQSVKTLWSSDGILANADVAVGNGNCYVCRISNTASGGDKTMLELRNPDASGELLLVDRIDFRQTDTMAYASLTHVTPPLGASSNGGENMLVGNGEGVGRISVVNQAAVPGTILMRVNFNGELLTSIIPPYPFIIPANNSIVGVAQTPDLFLEMTIFWRQFKE